MIEIEIGFTLYLYEIKDDLKHVLRLYTQLKTMRAWIHALLHISYVCMTLVSYCWSSLSLHLLVPARPRSQPLELWILGTI